MDIAWADGQPTLQYSKRIIRRFHRRDAVVSSFLLFLLIASLSLAGCSLGTFEETIDTQLTIANPGNTTEPVKITKRFTLSRDPADAKSVRLLSGSMVLLTPRTGTFNFLDRLEVWVVAGDRQLLLAAVDDIPQAAQSVEMDILSGADLRGYVENSGIRLNFVATPRRGFQNWPAEGYEISAYVVVEIEIF